MVYESWIMPILQQLSKNGVYEDNKKEIHLERKKGKIVNKESHGLAGLHCGEVQMFKKPEVEMF